MRNLKTPQDPQTLQLLKEGAEAASGKADTDKKFAQLQDQIRMIQYALGNVFKTLNTYSAVKGQVESMDYRTLGTIRALEKKLGADFPELVEQEAKAVQVEAFQEMSDADDKLKNLTAYEGPLEANDLVIFSTECTSAPDQGILRSKMDLGGQEFAEFKDSFVGKKVGETVAMKIQGQDHVATILGARRKATNVNANTTGENTNETK